MSKSILIIGGGISGLTVLHYLKQKYQNRADLTITLLEAQDQCGGTIRTLRKNGCHFETGPNGFLDDKPSALELSRELGLLDQLIFSRPESKSRYLCVKNRLYALPKNLMAFLCFPLLSFREKMRCFQEIFVKKCTHSEETIYEFGVRRLGKGFTQIFLDPMVSGIVAGDIQELNLKFTFPILFELEQTYGSLLKGRRKMKTKQRLCSFKNGMGQMIAALENKYKDSLKNNVPAIRIMPESQGYKIETPQKDYFANEIILSVPAFTAADLLSDFDKNLCANLRKIPYASLAVIGLIYSKNQIPKLPQGFGYLRPTHEQKEVLGVLFSSEIFAGRAPDDKILLQIMMGGAKNPDTVMRHDEELFNMAQNEIQTVLQANGKPQDQFLVRWNNVIPQYNRNYPAIDAEINRLLKRHPHLHLLANYRNGVSLNDCTANAKKLAQMIKI